MRHSSWKVLCLQLLLLCACGVRAQGDVLVTPARLDAAAEQVSANRAEEDPSRTALLGQYDNIRATLAEIQAYQDSLKNFSNARANAADKARDVQLGLAERQVAVEHTDVQLATAALQELEQAIQLLGAELEARRSHLADTTGRINSAPGRALAIRDRLTRLGTRIPELASALALMPTDVEPGSEDEADLWLAQAQLASARAEKASLDEELLSQPMRLELLKAYRDQAARDIAAMERRLQALQRRAGELRRGAAVQAQTEARMAVAGTAGKSPLLQELAERNAQLTDSFAQRTSVIEDARHRDAEVTARADELAADLEEIERKLNLLGLNISVGQILREQQIQLPPKNVSKREIAAVAGQITQSSLRQIELEDERRQLDDTGQYVDILLQGQAEPVADEVRAGLEQLALSRRGLIDQAIELEDTHAVALSNLDFSLRRYAEIVADYRQFISERLLWIPSRAPLALFREGVPGEQLRSMFAPQRWLTVLGQIPGEVRQRPLLLVGVVLALLLWGASARLRTLVVNCGREVGYVGTDLFSNTVIALGLTLLLALRWPALMFSLGLLFEMQQFESELATALHSTLMRGGGYLWGLEFMRLLLMPKGVVETHFRWPKRRTDALHHRMLRLEQSFFPAALVAIFCIELYPREVGGQIGALAMLLLLLSMWQFFRLLPEFLQDKMQKVFTDRPSDRTATVGTLLRRLLTWLPLVAALGVMLGYLYTAIEFALLLIRTIVLATLILLFYELGLRWLRMTRRRMVVRVRAELAQSADQKGEERTEDDEMLENDPELLSDEGTRLLNLMTLLIGLGALFVIWSGVFPALGILDSVTLWHYSGAVDGEPAQIPVTLGSLLAALALAVVGWLVLQRVPGLLEILLRQKLGLRPASAYAATRVIQYAGVGSLVAAVLASLGGSWSQIQWAVAALSVGIGFGLQEIVANFISGLIILFEQPVRVGDTVTVGNVSGRVTKIRIRATTIRDFDNRELLVPNKEFITQQLLNWSLSDQVTRWVLEVGVAYGTDLDRAMAVVEEVIKAHPLVLSTPPPLITFEQFGDSSLVITARFFMEQLDKRLQVASEVRLEINRRFNAEGIVVSFPQRDIHLDTRAPLEVTVVERASSRPSGQ